MLYRQVDTESEEWRALVSARWEEHGAEPVPCDTDARTHPRGGRAHVQLALGSGNATGASWRCDWACYNRAGGVWSAT